MKRSIFPVKSTIVAALVSFASFAQSDSPPTSSSPDTRSSGADSSSSKSKSKSTSKSQHEGSTTVGSNQSGQLNKDDLDFVKEAVSIGQYEVRISQLAATQASDPSVKELAQQMVSEHQSTNDELREIVEGKGYSLPMAMGSGSTGSSWGTPSGSSGSLKPSGASGSLGSSGTSGSVGSGSTGASGSLDSSGAHGSVGSGSTGSSGSIGSGSSSGSMNGTSSTTPGSIGNSGSSSGSTGSGASASGSTDSMDYNDTSVPGSDTARFGTPGSVGAGSTGSSGSMGSAGSSGVSGSVGTGGTGSGNTIAIDQAVQKKYDEKYEALSKLSGSKFDREFLANLTDGHKKSIKAFEKASKRANDSEIKSFATRTLPTLQQHLDRVQSIEKDVKGRRF